MEPLVYFVMFDFSKPSKNDIKQYVLDRSVVDKIIQRRPYTCVVLEFTFDGVKYIAAGFSKVCYPDKWSSRDGMVIAHKKAVDDIVEQLIEKYSK